MLASAYGGFKFGWILNPGSPERRWNRKKIAVFWKKENHLPNLYFGVLNVNFWGCKIWWVFFEVLHEERRWGWICAKLPCRWHTDGRANGKRLAVFMNCPSRLKRSLTAGSGTIQISDLSVVKKCSGKQVVPFHTTSGSLVCYVWFYAWFEG